MDLVPDLEGRLRYPDSTVPRFPDPAPAMSVEVQWTDADPDTGERRFVAVVKFARGWHFKVRSRRREGVGDEDVRAVRRIVADYREPPVAEPDHPT